MFAAADHLLLSSAAPFVSFRSGQPFVPTKRATVP